MAREILSKRNFFDFESPDSAINMFHCALKSHGLECIVFPFIIWFYGSAIAIIRGWGCGFGNSEHIVTWSDNRPSFTVLGFMAVVAYCRGI
jgi:hypothetical protein